MISDNSGNVNPFLDKVKKATAAAAADKAAGNDEWRVVAASTYQTSAKANSSKSYRDADNWNLQCGIGRGEKLIVTAEIDYTHAEDGNFRRPGTTDADAWAAGKRAYGTTLSMSGNLQVKLRLTEVKANPWEQPLPRWFTVYLPLQTKSSDKKNIRLSQRTLRDILASAYWHRFDENKPDIPTPRGPEALMVEDFWAFDGLVFPIITDYQEGWGTKIHRVITTREPLWAQLVKDLRAEEAYLSFWNRQKCNPYIENSEGIRLIVGVDIDIDENGNFWTEEGFNLS